MNVTQIIGHVFNCDTYKLAAVLNLLFDSKVFITDSYGVANQIIYKDYKLEMDCLEDTYINGFSIHIEYQSTLEDAHLFLNKLITLLQKDTIQFRFDYYSVDQEGNATSKEFTLSS